MVSVDACTEATGWFMTAAAAAWAAALAALAAAAAALDAASPPRGMVGGMVAPAITGNRSDACITKNHNTSTTKTSWKWELQPLGLPGAMLWHAHVQGHTA